MDKKQLVKLKLKSYNCSCYAILADNCEYSDNSRGIAPILLPIQGNQFFFKDAYVADKIIGKAVAELLAYSKVKYVYAETVSKSAIKVFDLYGIEYEHSVLTERIINRNGDGLCPMEQAVENSSSLSDSFDLILKKYESLNKKK